MDEIAYVLAHSGSNGINFLKNYGRDDDLEKRRATIYFLADQNIVDEEVLGFLDEAFHEPDLGLKTTSLWSYIHIEQFPLPRAELEKLLEGSEERLSALAMVYLSWAFPEESIEILEQALSSPNPRHRRYACDEVGDRNISELKPKVRELLHDADGDVRESAKSNLYW